VAKLINETKSYIDVFSKL